MRILHSLVNGLGRIVPALGDEDATQLFAFVTLGAAYMHFYRGYVRDLFDLGRTVTDAVFYYVTIVSVVCFHRLYLLTDKEAVEDLKRGAHTDGIVDPVNQKMHPNSMTEGIYAWIIWGFGTIATPLTDIIGFGFVAILYSAVALTAVGMVHRAFPDVALFATCHQLTTGVTRNLSRVCNTLLKRVKEAVPEPTSNKPPNNKSGPPSNPPIKSPTFIDNVNAEMQNLKRTIVNLENKVDIEKTTIQVDADAVQESNDQMREEVARKFDELAERLKLLEQLTDENSEEDAPPE